MQSPQEEHRHSVCECRKCKSRRLLALRFRQSLLSITLGSFLALAAIHGIVQQDHLLDRSPPDIAAAKPGQNNVKKTSGLGNLLSYIGGDSDSNCDGLNADSKNCLMKKEQDMCKTGSGEILESDLEMARIAWQYFENNYNPETGLVNSVNNYPSTTMWDTGSALAAFIAARDFNIISQKRFDDAIMALLETLSSIELFDGAAPNKVYHTRTKKMVDYGNNEVAKGIGVSVLDLARLISWMSMLQCKHPQYQSSVKSALSRWDYSRLIKDEQMYGLARDKKDDNIIHPRQEGRLGYEQYAGKIFERVGFSVKTSASYNNEHRKNRDILGVDIAFDNRDPRKFYANNYVVTESYAMDAMELGIDDDNRQLIRNIFEVQKKRWQETGIVTAISEDNIDRKPYFLYNSIYNAGRTFSTTNSSGADYDHLKSVSTKAALAMVILFPDDPYSDVLMSTVKSAYDPEAGWYSGVYESMGGYNDVTTANTNGVILSTLLYKKYGATFDHCDNCAQGLKIEPDLFDKNQTVEHCPLCDTSKKISVADE